MRHVFLDILSDCPGKQNQELKFDLVFRVNFPPQPEVHTRKGNFPAPRLQASLSKKGGQHWGEALGSGFQGEPNSHGSVLPTLSVKGL